MSFTAEEELRIQAIELTLNDLQTAANKMLTRQQGKALLNIRQQEIIQLQEDLETVKSQLAILQAG